jgi:hypothetical protein
LKIGIASNPAAGVAVDERDTRVARGQHMSQRVFITTQLRKASVYQSQRFLGELIA